MIAVIGSDRSELEPLLNKAHIFSRQKRGKTVIYLCGLNYQLNYQKFLVVETGYGKVNTAAGTAAAIAGYDIRKLIVLGNCGAVCSRGIQLTEVAVSLKSFQYDVDYTAIGYKELSVPGLRQSEYYADSRMIYAVKNAAKEARVKLHDGVFASADCFAACGKMANHIRCCHETDFVDVETGVIGQIAYSCRIPYVSVKGIADYVSGCAGEQYRKNARKANGEAAQLVFRMLAELLSESSHDGICREKCRIDQKHYKQLTPEETEFAIAGSKHVRLGLIRERDGSGKPYIVPVCFRYRRNPGGSYTFILFSHKLGTKTQAVEGWPEVFMEFEEERGNSIRTVTGYGKAVIIPTEEEKLLCDGFPESAVVIKVNIEAKDISGRQYFYRDI